MAGAGDAVVHDSVVAVDVVGHADDRNPPRGLLHRSNGGVPERHDKVDVACYKFARECGIRSMLMSAKRNIAGCCARAASGQATAAPPSSVMKARLRSGRDVRFIARPPHRTVRAAFPHTAPTSGV